MNSAPHIQHARPNGWKYKSSLLAMGPAFSKCGQISKSDMRSMEDWWLRTTTAAVGHFNNSAPSISNSTPD